MRIPQEDVAYNFKIVIVGAGGVGKTGLFNRYCFNSFNFETELTIGINFHSVYLNVLYNEEIKYVVNSIFDFGGQDRFKPLIPRFIEGVDGALLVFDSVSYSSFEQLDYWYEKLADNVVGPIPKILVGSKGDLLDKTPQGEIVSEDLINKFIETHKIDDFYRTSALKNYNILEVFEKLNDHMLNQQKIQAIIE